MTGCTLGSVPARPRSRQRRHKAQRYRTGPLPPLKAKIKASPSWIAEQKLQAEIQSLTDQLNRGGAALSKKARENLRRELDIQRQKMAPGCGEHELDQGQARAMQEIANKLIAVLGEYAKEHGYGVVLDLDGASAVWAASSPNIDITGDVRKLYDQKYPVQPAAAAPPAK